MEVRFTWQPREWREAHLLSTTEQDRGGGPVPMGYLFLGIMGVGCVGELAHALRGDRAMMMNDRLLPALLLVAVLSATVVSGLALVRRRDRFRDLPALPKGEQQMTLHEHGWRYAATQDRGPQPLVHAWSELRGLRVGRGVLALRTWDGKTIGLPLRALSVDQGSWLERLLVRKVSRRM